MIRRDPDVEIVEPPKGGESLLNLAEVRIKLLEGLKRCRVTNTMSVCAGIGFTQPHERDSRIDLRNAQLEERVNHIPISRIVWRVRWRHFSKGSDDIGAKARPATRSRSE